ncbi:MAG: hypothetical protein AAF394_02210 [Planctomycetota bacterium]
MPIILPPAPTLESKIFEQHLHEITQSTATGPPGNLLDCVPDNLSYTEPHKYYTVPLEAILSGQLIGAALPRNWRYLIVNDDIGVGELELSSSVNADGENVVDRFVALHHGGAAQATLNALHRAESDKAFESEDFELRFLRVCSLYFDAVWLHSEKRDHIIPTTDAIELLKLGQVYSPSDVIGVLTPQAVKAQEFEAQSQRRAAGLR